MNTESLTHKPMAKLNGIVKPLIPYKDVVRLYDELTTQKGLMNVHAAREIFKGGTPLGMKQKPFSTPESLASTMTHQRNALVMKNSVTKKPKVESDTEGSLRAQIKNILNLPGLDDATKLKVIGALVAA